tara:strand:+ start:17556 stop:17672 length:117 start_codon:yes stop_codon:yes gene_type:complete
MKTYDHVGYITARDKRGKLGAISMRRARVEYIDIGAEF